MNISDKSIRVLIVEDSKSTALALSKALSCFDIVGIAHSGKQAVSMCAKFAPHVITMDIQLPDTNGLEVTRLILAERKIPIIIVSTLVSPRRQGLVFEALRAGAYEVVAKSSFFDAAGKIRTDHKLVRLVRVAARHLPDKPSLPVTRHLRKSRPEPAETPKRTVLAIGASTGGPAALQKLFSSLRTDFPLPILVAQHMAHGFIEGFAHWLSSQTNLTVRIAEQNTIPMPACIYFPPSSYNLMVRPDQRLAVVPFTGQGPCPSVDVLFSSIADTYGSQAICILLTGMGSDGTQGMLKAKNQRALTIAQDKDSSVVFGMPQAALKAGAVEQMLALDKMPGWLALHLINPSKPT